MKNTKMIVLLSGLRLMQLFNNSITDTNQLENSTLFANVCVKLQFLFVFNCFRDVFIDVIRLFLCMTRFILFT